MTKSKSKSKKVKYNAKEEFIKIEKKLYEYPDKNVKNKEKYYSFIDELTKYGNTKLEALKMDERFNNRIDNLRDRFDIGFDCEGKNNVNNFENTINLFRSVDRSLEHMDDLFFKSLQILFEENKETIVDEEITYVLVCYYILFNTNIREKLLISNLKTSKHIVNDSAWSYNEMISRFDNIQEKGSFRKKVDEIRISLGISLEDTIENRAQIYNRYYHYVSAYGRYSSLHDPFSIELYNILNDFEFLNIDSEMDYILLHTYIVFNKKLAREDIISVFGAGLIKISTGEEILTDIHIINKDKLYVEIPMYANKSYLTNMVGYLYSKSSKHYKTTTSNQIPKQYYRDKAIYEIWEDIQREYNKISSLERRIELEKRINERFPGGYKDKKHFSKAQKGKNERAKNNSEGDEAVDLESSDKQELMNMIKRYKNTKQEFSKGRLR